MEYSFAAHIMDGNSSSPGGTSPFGQDDLIQGSGMFGSEYQVKMLEEYDLLTLPEDLKKCLERAIRMY